MIFRSISITFLSLILLLSCSHVNITLMQSDSQKRPGRYPTSVMQKNCMQNAALFFEKTLDAQIPQAQKELMKEQAEEFWSRVYRYVEKGSTTWWSRQKRRMLRVMQNINGNDFPVYYINDDVQTMPTILKVEEHFISARGADLGEDLGQEAITVAKSWMDRYENYVDDSNKLLSRYLSLQESINQLNGLKTKSLSYPTRQEFRFINSENSYVTEVKEFLNREKLIRFRDSLRTKAKEIERGIWWTKTGTLKERMLQQAEDKQRLINLYDRLNDVLLTNDARGIESPQELKDMVERTRNLIFDRPDLNPSKNIDSSLVRKELRAEFRYILDTFKNKPMVMEGRKFLESLTDSQKRILKIDDRGRAGEIIRYAKENKIITFVYAMTGLGGATYSLSWVAIETKDLFMSKAEKRMDCAKAENSDDQFFKCFQTYMVKKFKLEHPFTYVRNGYQGLYEALESDQDRLDEFKYEFDMFLRVRAKEVEASIMEEEFRKKFMDLINARVHGEDTQAQEEKLDNPDWNTRMKEDEVPRYKLIWQKLHNALVKD